MDARKCMIAWNGNSDDVRVGVWPDKIGWSDEYKFTSGACYSWFHKKCITDEDIKAFLFMEAYCMIVRDCVDPIAVHNAMIQIPQFKDGLPEDLDAAKRRIQ